MIVGTAGHVDHGKTSLIRALTGVETDRLAEEKRRGISIELGFAYARLDADAGSPIGFVDVPGHRDFVQTMVAGASGIDLGLLVVAADDSPMPQTREHLAILQWLAIPRLVVALTKIDRVDGARLDESRVAIDALLAGTPYRDAPVVPLSSVRGDGIDRMRAALLAERDRLDHEAIATKTDGRFRLAVDRAFVLQGIGLVVTGTGVCGCIAVDDQVHLLPRGLTARVRSIHANDEAVDAARAGQRLALNLAGRGIERSVVQRGDWCVDPALGIETERIDVRLAGTGGPSPFDVEHWRRVRFHAGAGSCNARIALLRAASGNDRVAQIVFDRPRHVLAGDRFVLRDASLDDGTPRTIAGGEVLDVDVPARGRRSEARLRFLDVAGRGDAPATLLDAIETSERGIDLARWNATRNAIFEASDVADATAQAIAGPTGTTLLSRARWDSALTRIVETLAAEHAATPDAVGPGRDRLRRMAAPMIDAASFGAMLDALKADGRIAQTGAWLHLPDHRVELSLAERARFDRVRTILDAAPEPNNPPRVRDLAKALAEDEATLRAALVRLAARGEVYRVAHDHYFLPATVRGLARLASEVAAADGVAKAAPFRDRIGVGRKVAIQILEFFDRIGYTRRLGDDHRIIQPTLFES